MFDFFSDAHRRNPYPLYEQARRLGPALHVPPPFDAWMVFDYDTVKRILDDPATYSSRVPAPKNWFTFTDAPEHTRLRAIISRAFTPRSVAQLEPRIREISRQLLDALVETGEMDLATDYAVPLPMRVIAEMIGLPPSDWATYRRWSDAILILSYARSGSVEAQDAQAQFRTVSAEMNDYLAEVIPQRRTTPTDDLLTRLIQAEVAGEHLTQAEILGFLQLLVVGGQETTANLINNAILCLCEHPDQLELLRSRPDLMPSLIEEVLRYRSPFQWLMRTPTREVELHGQRVLPGVLLVPMIGAANRDPKRFADPERFDITRDPNPHLAFGHGSHFCMGAPLSRLEASIALPDLLQRLPGLRLAEATPWTPRAALHVHGPSHLRVHFEPLVNSIY